MTAFDVNKTPKKYALSLQLDLEKFEKASDEEIAASKKLKPGWKKSS